MAMLVGVVAWLDLGGPGGGTLRLALALLPELSDCWLVPLPGDWILALSQGWVSELLYTEIQGGTQSDHPPP